MYNPILHIILASIRLYQKLLSPDTGLFSIFFPYGCCRFRPTCSEYLCQSLLRHGLVRGLSKGAWRIVRCNPFSHGGIDEVEVTKQ